MLLMPLDLLLPSLTSKGSVLKRVKLNGSSSLIRPPCTRAAMAQIRAATPSTYHPLLPSWTPLLLPIPLPAPSTTRRADVPEADTPPRKRLLLTAPRPGCEVGESSTAAAAR
ncbi:hypothetical protein Tco_1256399 [Tanacetum coccineum]